MDLNDFKMEDLTTEEKLNDFLQAVEDGLKNLKYVELKKIVDTITNEMKNKIVNVSGGHESIDTGNELIEDIMKVAVKLSESVQNDINNNTTLTKEDENERKELVDSMDKILSGLFEQDNLQKELINRGFSEEDLVAQVEVANERSKDIINDAKAEKRRNEYEAEKLLGRDGVIKTGVYMQKSAWTQVCDYKEAVTMFSVAKEQFDLLNNLKSKGTLTPDVQERIANIENNLKYLADGIKDLNINGIDNKIFENWTEDAKRAKITNEIDTQLKGLDTIRDGIYSDLQKKISTSNFDDTFKTKYKVDDLEKALNKLQNASTAKDKDDAKKEIDNYLMQRNAEIKMEPEKTIRAEKDLISIRNNGVETVKELAKQENDNSNIVFVTEKDEDGNEDYKTTNIEFVDKFGNLYCKYLMEPEKDENGNTIYEDAQKTKPKMVPVPETDENGVPLVDGDGKPKYKMDKKNKWMVDVYETEEITDEDTINKYLQTFVESEAIKNIQDDIDEYTGSKKDYESKEDYKQSKIDARKLLQDYKVGNKFTRFFAPKLLLKKHKDNLVNKILEERKKNYIKIKIKEDLEDGKFDNDSGLAIVNEKMKEIKERAAMHHRLFEAGQAQANRADKQKDAFNKDEFISNMEKASYESLAVELGSKGKYNRRATEDKIISNNTCGADMPAINKEIRHNDDIDR